MSLVWITLLLAVLLFFAATAIDIGYMYYVKNQLTVAADASSLAGVVEITDPNDLTQSNARAKAIEFAAKNTAAGIPVEIITDNSNTLGDDNDITVGNWDPTRVPPYIAGQIPVNAIEVRPQRVQGLSGTRGDVKVFVGQIFRVIGINWGYLSARARAVAAPKPLATPGILLCTPSCDFTSFPKNLIIQSDPSGTPIDDGMAWTAFSNLQAPNIGANGDVVDYIWSRKQPPPLCGLCITTNNGVGVAINELKDAFESTTYRKEDKDLDNDGNVIRWKVAVPILDRSCDNPCLPCDCNNPDPMCCSGCPGDNTNNCCACPPGGQGNTNERYHIEQIAEVHIISVNTTGSEKGITIDYINCFGCPTFIPSGGNVALVE